MVRIILLSLITSISASGQVWEFFGLEALPQSINSDHEEVSPLLSPDGKTLYFSRVMYPGNTGGKFGGSDIWVSKWDERAKAWLAAEPLAKINDKGNNAVVGFGSDGNTMYLMKTRSSARAAGIYVTKNVGGQWTRPELIPIRDIETLGFLGFYASPDFDVIFISMKGSDSRGEEDLYVTTRNAAGEWTQPKNLGSSINTSGFEISPFLSKDKNRLYFSSNGHKGSGDADIFYCDRLHNAWDTWTAPRNLGDKLNSKGFDAYFSLYGDTVAYFTSNRGGRYADIYRVKVVPGNDVLPFGQQYLAQSEMSRIVGANISRRVQFEGSSPSLSPGQKELVFFIGDKVADLRDINIQLLVLEENNPALTSQRLQVIADELRNAGVDNVRVLRTNIDRLKKTSGTRTVVELLLFK